MVALRTTFDQPAWQVKVAKTEQKRVVVVGAGFGGGIAAKCLDQGGHVHVTLVTPSSYFEDVTAQPRAVVRRHSYRKCVLRNATERGEPGGKR